MTNHPVLVGFLELYPGSHPTAVVTFVGNESFASSLPIAMKPEESNESRKVWLTSEFEAQQHAIGLRLEEFAPLTLSRWHNGNPLFSKRVIF
jgi:hypothetical protein